MHRCFAKSEPNLKKIVTKYLQKKPNLIKVVEKVILLKGWAYYTYL